MAARLHLLQTSQIGGKGTVRRRRVRKSSALPVLAPVDNAHTLQSFHSKHDLRNYGPMESVTFVRDNGEIQTTSAADQPCRLAANMKAGIFCLTISPSPIAATAAASSSSRQHQRHSLSSASRVEYARDMLDSLGTTSGENPEDDVHLQRRLDIFARVGSDAHEFLANLVGGTQSSEHTNKDSPSQTSSASKITNQEASSKIAQIDDQHRQEQKKHQHSSGQSTKTTTTTTAARSDSKSATKNKKKKKKKKNPNQQNQQQQQQCKNEQDISTNAEARSAKSATSPSPEPSSSPSSTRRKPNVPTDHDMETDNGDVDTRSSNESDTIIALTIDTSSAPRNDANSTPTTTTTTTTNVQEVLKGAASSSDLLTSDEIAIKLQNDELAMAPHASPSSTRFSYTSSPSNQTQNHQATHACSIGSTTTTTTTTTTITTPTGRLLLFNFSSPSTYIIIPSMLLLCCLYWYYYIMWESVGKIREREVYLLSYKL